MASFACLSCFWSALFCKAYETMKRGRRRTKNMAGHDVALRRKVEVTVQKLEEALEVLVVRFDQHLTEHSLYVGCNCDGFFVEARQHTNK